MSKERVDRAGKILISLLVIFAVSGVKITLAVKTFLFPKKEAKVGEKQK